MGYCFICNQILAWRLMQFKPQPGRPRPIPTSSRCLWPDGASPSPWSAVACVVVARQGHILQQQQRKQ